MTLKVWYCGYEEMAWGSCEPEECRRSHDRVETMEKWGCGWRLLINPDDERTWRLVKDAIEDWFEATHCADVVSFGEAASAVLHALEVE